MPRTMTQKDAVERLQKDAANVNHDDLRKVLDQADEIKRKFSATGPLGRLIKDIKLLLSLLQDYWDKSYREIPWWAIASVVAALLYLLMPIDWVPDFIPLIGYLDDAVIVAACLLMIEQQLAEYELWKVNQPDKSCDL